MSTKPKKKKAADESAAPSKEALAFKAAFELSGLTQKAVADHMEVTAAAVRQWIEGERPIPIGRALRLAKLLDTQPQKICAEYGALAADIAETVASNGVAQPADLRRPDLAENRLENSIDALRFALAGIVAVTVKHRPAEALAVAAQLRRSVPRKFQQRGLIHELLVTLDAAADE
jgi:transcriptional regulator with XRE-family HTH domain